MIETKRTYRELLSALKREEDSKKKREWIALKYAYFCNLCSFEYEWGAISDQLAIMKMRNEIDNLYHLSNTSIANSEHLPPSITFNQ